MKAKSGGKKPRLLHLLALGVLVTTVAASTTLAKYTTTLYMGTDVVVAAFAGGAFDFNLALDDMSPGKVSTAAFKVRNFSDESSSEVALLYEIKVETTGNLPLEFSLTGAPGAGGGTAAGALAQQTDATTWLATGGMLPVVETESDRTTHDYTLTVTWPADKTSGDYSDEIDMVTVTVTATQANPAG